MVPLIWVSWLSQPASRPWFANRTVAPPSAPMAVAQARGHAYDSSRPLRAWLTGIVFRVARDYRRTVRRRSRPELIPDLPEEAPMPDHQVAVARTRSLVLQALHALPEPQRELLVRHELD